LGSAGTEWEVADVISASRMNQKTTFVGTGAQIAALGTTYVGMLVFCTSTASGFTKDVLYERNTANTSWNPVGLDQLPYLTLSTTIGDYSQPASAVATSEAESESDTDYIDTSALTINSGINVANSGADATRCGNRIQSGHASIGKTINYVKMNLKKVGSPTGIWTVEIRRLSDDAIVSTANIDVSTLATSNTLVTISNFDVPRTLVAGDRIMLVANGGNASNYVTINGSTTHTSGIDRTLHNGSYNDSSAVSMLMVANGDTIALATLAVDDSTSTQWKSNSEASPAIYVDLSSAREVVAVALHIDITNTTITAIKIRGSTDTSFTDAENIAYINISDFTDDTWRFLAINFLAANVRYVQVIGVGTGVLAINEIKVRYGVSDLIKILTHRHRTRIVDSADAFVDSD